MWGSTPSLSATAVKWTPLASIVKSSKHMIGDGMSTCHSLFPLLLKQTRLSAMVATRMVFSLRSIPTACDSNTAMVFAVDQPRLRVHSVPFLHETTILQWF